MAEAQLKINIVVDPNNAISGFKAAAVSMEGLRVESLKTAEGIKYLGLQNSQGVAYSKAESDALKKQAEACKDLEAAAARVAKANKDVGTTSNDAAAGVKKIGENSRGILGPVNDAYGAIRKLAFILPGIGIAGIFSLIGEGIVSAFSSTKEATDGAIKALEDYKKKVDDVISSNVKEAATVDILVQKIQSGTLSRQETVNAIKELQKIAPDYFGKLDAEKAGVQDVTRAYAAYNSQIVKTIEAQLRIAEISDLVKQRLTASQQTPEAAKFIDDLIAQGKTLEQISAIVTEGTQKDIRAQAELLSTSKHVSDEQLKQSLLQSQIPGGVLTILRLRQQELDIIKQINAADVEHLVKLPKEKVEKPEVENRLKEEPLAFGTLLDTSNLDRSIKTIKNKLDKTPPIHIPIDFNALDATERAQALGDKMADILSKSIESGFEGVGQSIGDALGKGQDVAAAAGKAILSLIGTTLEQLGKALIAYGLAQEAVQIALKSFNPYVAIAAGAAAIIAGSYLKSVATKPHAMAEGGLVTGPQLALLGERGPEAVVPLNRLSSFANQAVSPSTNITGIFKIAGNDLKLVLARADKNQGLAG